MKKVWKWLTPVILILLALILAFMMFFVYIRYIKIGDPYDPNNSDTWISDYNIVFEWEVLKLREGMTIEEIYNALGKPMVHDAIAEPVDDIGGGPMIFAYRCFSGRTLLVWPKDGTYRFEETITLNETRPDQTINAVICLLLSTATVLGGYTVIRLFRKKKAALQVSPEDTPDPGEAQ